LGPPDRFTSLHSTLSLVVAQGHQGFPHTGSRFSCQACARFVHSFLIDESAYYTQMTVELSMTAIAEVVSKPATPAQLEIVRPFSRIGREDVSLVGGKGANLGEMTRCDLPVPTGFVVTVLAYARFLAHNALSEKIRRLLGSLDVDDTEALQRAATAVRGLILNGALPADVRDAVLDAYHELRGTDPADPPLAVRSSATAEDTGEFSFAGMFESFLNVRGEEDLLKNVRACWASTFGARVLFYRQKQGLPIEMPIAVIVQRLVNAEKSGVMFTADPATHDRDRIVIEAAWGFGEVVVGGQVVPDRYVLEKSTLRVLDVRVSEKELLLTRDSANKMLSINLRGDPRATARVLTDDELRTLGALAKKSEDHYGAPQDLEFAIEGASIYLTQTRPITTLGGSSPTVVSAPQGPIQPLLRGLGASPGQSSGPVRVLSSPTESAALRDGDVLVARMTSPDWVPLMRRAAAIVTDAGGMTSHAAIVSRELGVPCVVGTRDATRVLRNGTYVSVDGSAGIVTLGDTTGGRPAVAAKPPVAVRHPSPVTVTRIYVNLAEPDRADEIADRDVDGVGLLRAEFMMLEALEHTHPRVFIDAGRQKEFVSRMTEGLRRIGRAFAPRPVIYRAMDFRSNEFRGLTGGAEHEPAEENPMIGYRGCFRYTKEPELFTMELSALADARREYKNLHLMIPFVRTGRELAECLTIIDHSAVGADRSLLRWIMAEVPSVVAWLPEYARMGIDGVSIGSNDLTQLILGVDRDSDVLASLFDERDAAVLDAIHAIIDRSRAAGLTCSICGQAPSVYPEYAEQLVAWGIDSISINPDAIDRTRANVARAEQRIILDGARELRGTAPERP
jgi:pyruvate,water dikinase